MMEQANCSRDRLRLDGGQAQNGPSIVAPMSNTSVSKINVREEGLTVLSEAINPAAE
jgi:hypothetical protein